MFDAREPMTRPISERCLRKDNSVRLSLGRAGLRLSMQAARASKKTWGVLKCEVSLPDAAKAHRNNNDEQQSSILWPTDNQPKRHGVGDEDSGGACHDHSPAARQRSLSAVASCGRQSAVPY